jgi:hypothetical protein
MEMERKTESSDAQEAFYILNSFYEVVSRGQVGEPGGLLSIVREASGGEKFSISRYRRIFNVQVIEPSGMEMRFRVDEEGLSAASFVGESGKHKDVSLSSLLFLEDRKNFQELAPTLAPWFIDRYMNIDIPRPLPKNAQKVINQTFKRAL